MACAAGLLAAQSRTLDIYWIDVEGGGATLIVSPSGQSLLVDAGNPGPDDRDAKRVFAVAQMAGLTKIDMVLTTHFHGDHVGGTPALSKMIPIGRYFDHGDSIETTPAAVQLFHAYQAVAEGKRTTVKPGDRIPLSGVSVEVVSANGAVLSKPIHGGGPNPFCADAKAHDPDKTENQRSAGFLLTYGKVKFLDIGDLTWDKEMELACPVNQLGTITLLQATHHGFVNDFSGAPALYWSLKPQVVVVNDGPRKGLQVSAWETIQKIQGLEGVWQSHLALATDRAHNTDERQIANLEATAECKGNWLKASVAKDGKFTLTNGRNGYSQTYTAR
ncbi:MAG: MBL fold metallo-hydrolase [Acidobacteriia bacterium]|nr:MBL fold metallo-hydrolase [Terriglobia bacterium]